MSTEPHWVYVFRNSAGIALYVGCTSNLSQRIRAHHVDKKWYGEVASVSAEVYPSRDEGVHAEAALIAQLRPLYERSPANAAFWGLSRSLPCRCCHRGRHGDCVGINKRGEKCPCKVCRTPVRMGADATPQSPQAEPGPRPLRPAELTPTSATAPGKGRAGVGLQLPPAGGSG